MSSLSFVAGTTLRTASSMVSLADWPELSCDGSAAGDDAGAADIAEKDVDAGSEDGVDEGDVSMTSSGIVLAP